jgi:hypothetical protein
VLPVLPVFPVFPVFPVLPIGPVGPVIPIHMLSHLGTEDKELLFDDILGPNIPKFVFSWPIGPRIPPIFDDDIIFFDKIKLLVIPDIIILKYRFLKISIIH